MNLERMRQAAIEESKEKDKWAVICTDGDYEYARSIAAAMDLFEDTVGRTEYLSGEHPHNYGLVRVDIDE